MSRVIRFRAWSKKDKQFVYDFIIDRLGNEYQTNKCEFWGDDRDIVLMQFTGLLDSKGVEIYEGDIVKNCNVHGYGFLSKGAISVVEFNQKELCYFMNGKFRLTAQRKVEVIGNIQQNPELLASPERKV